MAPSSLPTAPPRFKPRGQVGPRPVNPRDHRAHQATVLFARLLHELARRELDHVRHLLRLLRLLGYQVERVPDVDGLRIVPADPREILT